MHKHKQKLPFWRASSSWEKVSKTVCHKDIPCLLTCTVHVYWIPGVLNCMTYAEPTKHQARTWLITNEVSYQQLADNKEENHIQTYHIFLQEYTQQCKFGEEWSLQHRRSLLSTLSRSLNPEKQPHYSDNCLQPHRQLYKPDRRSFQSRGRLGWK